MQDRPVVNSLILARGPGRHRRGPRLAQHGGAPFDGRREPERGRRALVLTTSLIAANQHDSVGGRLL